MIGEKAARISVHGHDRAEVPAGIVLVIIGYFTPLMLVVLAGLVYLRRPWQMFPLRGRRSRPPSPKAVWPMWFVAAAFYHNRSFGHAVPAGLILDVVVKLVFQLSALLPSRPVRRWPACRFAARPSGGKAAY